MVSTSCKGNKGSSTKWAKVAAKASCHGRGYRYLLVHVSGEGYSHADIDANMIKSVPLWIGSVEHDEIAEPPRCDDAQACHKGHPGGTEPTRWGTGLMNRRIYELVRLVRHIALAGQHIVIYA